MRWSYFTAPVWQKSLIQLSFLVIVILMVYWQSWYSMIEIWWRSETFVHGFIVAPTAIWLVWQNRELYRQLPLRPNRWILMALLALGAMWMAANLIHAVVVEQYAVVGLLIAAIALVMGTDAIKRLAFPVAFLLLMVPVGEDLVPPLMEFTAGFVVTIVRWLGITVYQEGLHFTLPSGRWSVIEACSGIRYLIASITLGAVYAHLNYQSWRKRLCFLLVSALIPIVANGLRALLIVLIGHFSAMQLATGFDHIVYGWLFFGLVIWALFKAGGHWRDPLPQAQTMDEADLKSSSSPGMILLLSAVVCLLIWPGVSGLLMSKQLPSQQNSHQLVVFDGQTTFDPGWGWRPRFRDIAFEQLLFWQEAIDHVGVYVAGFANDTGHSELINSQHLILLESDRRWRVTSEQKVATSLGFEVEQTVLSEPQRQLLVWRWYQVGDQRLVSSYDVKWRQLIKRLQGDAAPELMWVLYSEIHEQNPQKAAEDIQKAAQICCIH